MSIRSRPLTDDMAFFNLFEDAMLHKHVAMPGIIRQINLEGSTLVSVNAQPVIQQFIASEDQQTNTTQNLPIIVNVPVVLPYAQTAGYVVTLPIQVGDDCLLIFSDRSIDNWQDNGGLQPPIESTVPRSHDLTDAICIPGIINNLTTVPNYQFDAIEVRDINRLSFVNVKNDAITLKSTTITIEAENITLNGGAVNVNGSRINLNAPTYDSKGILLDEHRHLTDLMIPTSGPIP